MENFLIRMFMCGFYLEGGCDILDLGVGQDQNRSDLIRTYSFIQVALSTKTNI